MEVGREEDSAHLIVWTHIGKDLLTLRSFLLLRHLLSPTWLSHSSLIIPLPISNFWTSLDYMTSETALDSVGFSLSA